MNEQVGIITRDDLDQIEKKNGNINDDDAIDNFVIVIAFIFIIGFIAGICSKRWNFMISY